MLLLLPVESGVVFYFLFRSATDDPKLILEQTSRFFDVKLEVEVYLLRRELAAAGASDCSMTSFFFLGPLRLTT